MNQRCLEVQLLLYVEPEMFIPCTEFYENVLGLEPFYGWDDGPEDRGRKYKVAGTVLVVLAQECPFGEPLYPVNFQIEVEDAERLYETVAKKAPEAVTQTPFTRPYGWRMFRLRDPAGNRINFYHIP